MIRTLLQTLPDGTKVWEVKSDAGVHLGEDRELPVDAEGAVTNDLLAKALQAIATLENADANWPALTPAQRDGANRIAVRVAAKLARLATRTLDAS